MTSAGIRPAPTRRGRSCPPGELPALAISPDEGRDILGPRLPGGRPRADSLSELYGWAVRSLPKHLNGVLGERFSSLGGPRLELAMQLLGHASNLQCRHANSMLACNLHVTRGHGSSAAIWRRNAPSVLGLQRGGPRAGGRHDERGHCCGDARISVRRGVVSIAGEQAGVGGECARQFG